MTSSIATAIATFLLYTNLVVVTAQRGVIPTAAAVVVPGLLALAVAHRLVVRREGVIVDRTLLLMFGFLAVLLGSAFAARGFDSAISRISVFVLEGIAIYFLVRNAIHGLAELRIAVIAVILAATLLAGLTVYQAATGAYQQEFLGLAQRSLEHLEGAAPRPGGAEMSLEDRAGGPVGEPNRYAQILMMALPLAFVLGLNARTRIGGLIGLACTVVLLGGVVYTYSRGGFLTLVVLVLLTIPYRLIRPGRVLAMVTAGVVLAPLVAPAYAGRVLSISGVAGVFGHAPVEADGATRGRTTEMLAALAAYTDHAVLGVGPGQYLPYYSVHYQAKPEISIREIAEPRRAHSLYLEMAAEVGTVGLLVFLSIPFLLLRDLRALRLELRRRRPDLARVAAGFSLVLLAYLGTGAFLHLAFERYYWFMVGLTAAAAGVLDRWTAVPELDIDPASEWARRPTSI